MKKSLLIIFLVVIIIGCAKKQEVWITEWEKFQDPYLRISFVHPRNWLLQQEGSTISFYSSPEALVKFNPYSVEGKDAARIMVIVQKDSLNSLEENARLVASDLNTSGFEVSPTEEIEMANTTSKRIHYRGALDTKNIIEGDQVLALRDSMLYVVKYEAFNKLYTAHRAALDSVIHSIRLPAPKVVAKDVDPSIPSEETEVFENEYLKITYPANFTPSSPSFKEPIVFSLDLMGYRKDSYIHVDVMPSQGLSSEKVVEQNAKFFKETSRGQAVIDGVPTTYLNYSPMRDIQSRVYFLVKDDKIYRIIFNYYQPMKSVFLPVFEKTVNSLAVK